MAPVLGHEPMGTTESWTNQAEEETRQAVTDQYIRTTGDRGYGSRDVPILPSQRSGRTVRLYAHNGMKEAIDRAADK
ncbi:hypothetical protein ACOMHN_037202 [Nucella lapillus]